jgi:hypothetical protein
MLAKSRLEVSKMSELFKRGSKDKKGAVHIPFMAILVILLIVGGAYWIGKSSSGGSSLTVVQNEPGQTNTGGNVPAGSTINLFGKTTVKFSSWDFYNKGTNAGTGHLLLSLKGSDGQTKLVGAQYNDDGTETVTAPGDSYVALLGNKTSSLTAGTDYYPVLLSGVFPDKETYSIASGQYKTAGASQVTFTYFNKAGDTNTAQALTTSDDKMVKWELSPNADTCVGNPDTSGSNVMTYNYNSTVFTKVQQYNGEIAESTTGTPNGAQVAISGISTAYSQISYPFPVICGPASVTRQVRLMTGTTAEPSTINHINMTVSDVSWGYDSRTYETIKGFTDNNNADLGVTDFFVGNLIVS